MTDRLALTRDQVLAHRRRAGSLDRRMPAGATSLRRAAWAGLQDSMPRAAVLSIHARVANATPAIWEDPAFVQVWGPRFSSYVIPAQDRAVFTLGRLPDDAKRQREFQAVADKLERFLDGRRMTYSEAGHGLGVTPNSLRYGAPTGRILIRWDGARRPEIWTVPAPDVDPFEARLELARRYLHVIGPGTATSFEVWAGIRSPRGKAAFEALAGELVAVTTPIGDGWILASDQASFLAPPGDPALARLLPSGDTFYLLQGKDRDLLVPDAARRPALWTSRVWPGAVVIEGQVAGVWRRAGPTVTITTWRRLSASEREAVEREAESFPLPDLDGGVRVTWEG